MFFFASLYFISCAFFLHYPYAPSSPVTPRHLTSGDSAYPASNILLALLAIAIACGAFYWLNTESGKDSKKAQIKAAFNQAVDPWLNNEQVICEKYSDTDDLRVYATIMPGRDAFFRYEITDIKLEGNLAEVAVKKVAMYQLAAGEFIEQRGSAESLMIDFIFEDRRWKVCDRAFLGINR